jgi:hypothetical protein
MLSTTKVMDMLFKTIWRSTTQVTLTQTLTLTLTRTQTLTQTLTVFPIPYFDTLTLNARFDKYVC